MNDPQQCENAYRMAGLLLGASYLNRPILGDFTVDGTAFEDDFSTPDAACTSLTVNFCGAVAASIYQTGAGVIPDYKNLQAQAMANLSVGDVAAAEPYRAVAWQRATTVMNSMVDRLDNLAGDLMAGNSVDASHPSLQFGQPADDSLDDDTDSLDDDSLDDDSLDDDSTLTAMGGRTRQWSNLQTTDLTGNPL